MRRRTVTLPDELSDALDREAMLRGASASEVVRILLETRLIQLEEAEQDLPFIGIADSGGSWDASRFDEELDKTWPEYLTRHRGDWRQP